jgi:hypothetical protein
MTPAVESYSATTKHSYTQARRHERMPVDFSVTLRWPGLRMADRARDLSEGGLAVETRDPLEPMTLVSMRLELPHTVPVDLLGRVMWTRGETMGIRFESTDGRVFDSLQRMRTDLERL